MRTPFAIFIAVLFVIVGLGGMAMADEGGSSLPPLEIPRLPDWEHVKESLSEVKREFTRMVWSSKTDESGSAEHFIDFKIFQTNAVFGGMFSFFSLIVVIYVSVFAFNIVRDSVVGAKRKAMKMAGIKEKTNVSSMISPISFASDKRENPAGAQKTAAISKPEPAAVPVKKRFFFCEILLNFIKPAIGLETVKAALMEQRQRGAGKKIGELLMEKGIISEQELEKTLKAQQQYRGQS